MKHRGAPRGHPVFIVQPEPAVALQRGRERDAACGGVRGGGGLGELVGVVSSTISLMGLHLKRPWVESIRGVGKQDVPLRLG